MQDKLKNKRWQEYHAAITSAYVHLISILSRTPTIREIEKELARPASINDPNKVPLKMGVDTICKHLQELRFEPTEHPLRVLSDNVLLNIYNASKKSPASQKLWFQLMEGYVEKSQVEGGEGKPLESDTYNFNKLTEEKLAALIAISEEAKIIKDAGGEGNTDS